MNSQQAIIDYLSTQSSPVTRTEIVADLRHHFEAKPIGNAIDRLRAAGVIETGPSEYDKGRAVLTYQLSRQAAIHHPAPAVQAQATPTDPEQPGVLLNPNDPLFSHIIALVEALKHNQARTPKIHNKADKIKALTTIARSPLINDDIADFLGQIAQDLEQLEEASCQ